MSKIATLRGNVSALKVGTSRSLFTEKLMGIFLLVAANIQIYYASESSLLFSGYFGYYEAMNVSILLFAFGVYFFTRSCIDSISLHRARSKL